MYLIHTLGILYVFSLQLVVSFLTVVWVLGAQLGAAAVNLNLLGTSVASCWPEVGIPEEPAGLSNAVWGS